MECIVAYQFRNGIYLHSDSISDHAWNSKCYIRFGPSVHMMNTVIAKWTIKMKIPHDS